MKLTDTVAKGIFKAYEDSDRGIQNVFTPVRTIENSLDMSFNDFLSEDMREVAVIFNWEFFTAFRTNKNNYINNIKFTYFYDSEVDKEMLEFALLGSDLNIEFVNITDFNEKNKDINVIKKAMANKHFDIVFSNPPYNGNIDLKILQTMFDYADKIIFIHPATFLLDKKFKKKLYNDVRNTNYLEKAVFVWGNQMFNIGLFCPVTISVWNKEHDSNIVEVIDKGYTGTAYTCDVNDISMHGEYFQKVKRFLNCKSNLQNNVTDENELTDYSVALPLIRTGVTCGIDGFTGHFTSILGLDDNNYKCDHTFRYPAHASAQQKLHYGFSSEEERENFLGYCKTKIVRFLLSITKTNANLGRGELEIIPWMDFTQEWNDAKLCKEFNIDEELWNYINNFIPDYYEDYDDGFTNKAKNVISRHHGVEPNDEMKTLCPADVIDYLMHTPITCKSGVVTKSFSKEGYHYQAYKRNNNDGDDTTFAWCVTRNAKRQNVNK